MTPRARFLRFASISLLSIGLFSLMFSLLAENGLWPELAPGTLHGSDRIAGFLAAIGLVIILARRNPSEPGADPVVTHKTERQSAEPRESSVSGQDASLG